MDGYLCLAGATDELGKLIVDGLAKHAKEGKTFVDLDSTHRLCERVQGFLPEIAAFIDDLAKVKLEKQQEEASATLADVADRFLKLPRKDFTLEVVEELQSAWSAHQAFIVKDEPLDADMGALATQCTEECFDILCDFLKTPDHCEVAGLFRLLESLQASHVSGKCSESLKGLDSQNVAIMYL